MRTYRRFIIGEKERMAGVANDRKSFRRGARSLIHYGDYVGEYLAAKRDVIAERRRTQA